MSYDSGIWEREEFCIICGKPIDDDEADQGGICADCREQEE